MMGEKFNKIYWLKNFETWKNLTFSENKISLDPLKSYNENWYNIYETVNTFIWSKRQIKDLAEIKSCFIDIDYPEIIDKNLSNTERASFMKDKYTKLCEKLGSLKKVYWITPSIFNATYKGFHILFHYSEDCYFINEDLHLKINDILNEYLWWDPNARDLARVYKTVWFIDWKEGRKRKIKSFAGESSGFLNITKTIIKERFWFEFKEREIDNVKKKQRSQEKKEIVKNSNIEKINNLDSWYFIWKIISYLNYNEDIFCPFDLLWKDKNIEKNFYLLKIKNKLKYKEINENLYKFYEEDGETLTAGLTLEKDENWLLKINDYSQKNRRWNYNFLKNWILKDKEFDYTEFSKILFNTTSLVLTSNLDKKSQIDSKLLWDFHNKNIEINTIKTTQENKELIKSKIDEELSKPWFKKTFKGLFIYLNEKINNKSIQINSYWSYAIEFNDFLEQAFNVKDETWKKRSRKILKNLLYDISWLRFPFIEKNEYNWKIIDTIVFKSIIEFSIKQGWSKRWDKDIFFIKPLLSLNLIFSNTPAFSNKNILSYKTWFTDTAILDFFLEVDDILNNTNHNYSEKLEIIFKKIKYNWSFIKNKQNLKHHLENWIKLWYFKDYKITEKNLIISKYKFEKI